MRKIVFYRLEGRRRSPKGSPYAGQWSEWLVLDGRTRIGTAKEAIRKLRKAIKEYDLNFVRIVKVTHEPIAGCSAKRKGVDRG